MHWVYFGNYSFISSINTNIDFLRYCHNSFIYMKIYMFSLFCELGFYRLDEACPFFFLTNAKFIFVASS